jgi:hypothetical protein
MSEHLEGQLRDDLRDAADRLADDQSSADVYRALTSRIWFKGDAGEGVALSWKRAEELVNELRAAVGREPLELAQSGGEGDVSAQVEEALGGRGWRSKPLDTSSHDERHLDSPEDEPRTPPNAEWERVAHAEADRNE